MGISDKTCLRIRVVLYLLFILSYAVGIIIFIQNFNNYWAASGFFLACIFIAVALALYVVPDEKLTNIFPRGGKKRILFQSGVLISSLGILGVALYLLARGIMLGQSWTGESYFCSFIAFMTASKWCFFIGYRVHKAKIGAGTVEADDVVEKLNLFEDIEDDWQTEKKKMPV